MANNDFIAYKESIESTVAHLDTNIQSGLSSAEAKARIEKYGPNELEAEEKRSLLQKFLDQFKDFMIAVLLVAAAVSAFVGVAEGEGVADAVVILIVVILNAIMGVFQEAKAEEAIDALKDMASPDAKVRRDGQVHTVKSFDLVPGDVVLLEAGDVVPADIRLVEASSLKVEEAALTGESVPVEKEIIDLSGKDAGIGDRLNMAFSSTNITYGRAVGVVTSTGMNTEVGNIATMLASTESQLTPLQRDQNNLGKVLTYMIIAIAVLTFAVGV